jgi:hypothetical protein
MLLEAALQSKHVDKLLPKNIQRRLRDIRYTVKRFVFDESASVAAGKFATECADLVCANAEFAIAPYEECFIEIDHAAAIRASSRIDLAENADPRIGFLFLKTGDVLVCSGDEDKADFTPFRYFQIDGDEAPTGDQQISVRNFILGEIAVELRPAIEEFSHKLTDIWSYELMVDLPNDVAVAMAMECVGELKRALAALLLLNQRRAPRFTEVGPRRTIRKGKAKTYLAHSVVSIDISSGGTRGLFRIGDRATPRRHEVIGHFVHRGIDEGCGHEWVGFSTPEGDARDMERLGRLVKRWRCGHCGGLRVRREAFSRGDARKGYVTKEYKVTASNGDLR